MSNWLGASGNAARQREAMSDHFTTVIISVGKLTFTLASRPTRVLFAVGVRQDGAQ
jgi:hypothetical protein